jgi:Fe2+ or Zn2+ uptake regulation protein
MRLNVYKDKVLAILEKEHLLSIADIREKLSGVDFSTVFRNVEQLVAEGMVKKVVISKDTVLYEVIRAHTHDHFICNDCGKVEEIHVPRTSIKNRKIDDITVRGSCTECNA